MAIQLRLSADDLNATLADNANIPAWANNGISFGNTDPAQQLRLVKNAPNGRSAVRAIDRARALRTPVVGGVPTATALDALKLGTADADLTFVFSPASADNFMTLLSANTTANDGMYKKFWAVVEKGQWAIYSHDNPSAKVEVGKWYIVTYTIRNVGGGQVERRTYHNNRFVGRSRDAAITLSEAVPWTLFSMASTDGTTAYQFQGDIAHVEIHDAVRSDAVRSADTVALAAYYNIPLETPPAKPSLRLVLVGDSQAQGNGADNGGRVSEALRVMLPASVEIINMGMGGWTIGNLVTDAPNIDIFADDDVPTLLAIHIGTNNIAQLAEMVAQILGGFESYCLARRAAGWTPIRGKYIGIDTILPRDTDTFGAGSASFEDERTTINAALRKACPSYADLLLDGGAEPNIGVVGAVADTAVYYDKTHLTEEANRFLAAVYRAAIQQFLQNTASHPTTAQIASAVQTELGRPAPSFQW